MTRYADDLSAVLRTLTDAVKTKGISHGDSLGAVLEVRLMSGVLVSSPRVSDQWSHQVDGATKICSGPRSGPDGSSP